MKNILVCDDDEGILDVVKMALSDEGYNILTVRNGKEVLKSIETQTPDLVLLDLWIPGLTGEKIVKTFKTDQKLKHIPVIIFSANRNIEKIAKEVQADGFLPKPFDLEDLENIIKKFI